MIKKTKTCFCYVILLFLISTAVCGNIYSQTTPALDGSIYNSIKETILKVEKEKMLKRIQKIQDCFS